MPRGGNIREDYYRDLIAQIGEAVANSPAMPPKTAHPIPGPIAAASSAIPVMRVIRSANGDSTDYSGLRRTDGEPGTVRLPGQREAQTRCRCTARDSLSHSAASTNAPVSTRTIAGPEAMSAYQLT